MNDTSIIEALRSQNAELRRKVSGLETEVADLEKLNIVAVDNAIEAERAGGDALEVRRLAEVLRDALNVHLGDST